MKTNDLKTLLTLKLNELANQASQLETAKENPTIAPMYHSVQGRIQALEAVHSLVAHKSRIDFSLL